MTADLTTVGPLHGWNVCCAVLSVHWPNSRWCSQAVVQQCYLFWYDLFIMACGMHKRYRNISKVVAELVIRRQCSTMCHALFSVILRCFWLSCSCSQEMRLTYYYDKNVNWNSRFLHEVINYIGLRTRTKFGERAFCVSGPTIWNSLPESLWSITCTATFKRHLKTHFLS